MTAGEIIAKLQRMPKDTPVYFLPNNGDRVGHWVEVESVFTETKATIEQSRKEALAAEEIYLDQMDENGDPMPVPFIGLTGI